jgi:hypothetical protein
MKKEEEKNKTFYLPLLHVQGKKKEEQCRSKQHCSALFFFNMKWRRFGQKVPFHLNMAPARSFPNQSLIYPLFI